MNTYHSTLGTTHNLPRTPSYPSWSVLTVSHSSCFVLSMPTVGYDIPARFQTTGLSESSNVKLASISERTTSVHRFILRMDGCTWFTGADLLISSCENVKPLCAYQGQRAGQRTGGLASAHMHDRAPPKNVILFASSSL